MAACAYIYVVDHDDRETFGHYKKDWDAAFYHSSSRIFKEDDLAVPVTLMKRA